MTALSLAGEVTAGDLTAGDLTAGNLTNSLAPIGLDELNELAALQTRVDRKYLVEVNALDAVVADLDADTRVLEIDGSRASLYESVYFDTAGLDSYQAAAHRRRRRFKVRTRAYLDSTECYLEVKTRGGRSLTVKERVEHPVEKRSRLTGDGLDYVDFALAGAGIDGIGATSLHATLATRYRRTTLYVPSSDSRATIDVDLSWTETDDRGTAGAGLRTPALAIVETKSGSTPSRVDRVLWSHGLRPVNISKYGVGMAAIHRELPANKWHRVLESQLRPAMVSTHPSLTPHPIQGSTS